MPELVPSPVMMRLRDRRALLWVCQRHDLRPGEQPHDYNLESSQAAMRYRSEPSRVDSDIASTYWEAVWLEGAASPLITAFREAANGDGPKRPIVVLASEDDTSAKLSSREFLPISVLPGVLDSELPVTSQFGTTRGRIRERIAWALSSRLEQYRGRALVVLGAESQADLSRLYEVLEDCRILDLELLVLWPTGTTAPELPEGLPAATHLWRGTASDFAAAVIASGVPLASHVSRFSIWVRNRTVSLSTREVDRVATRFALLTEQHITPASTFTMDNLIAFLNGSLDDWSAYGVGLPVERNYQSQNRTLSEDVVSLLQDSGKRASGFWVKVPAEPGSGATTLIRHAAFAAARAGFPTLVLRPEQVAVDMEELSAFATSLSEASLAAGIEQMPSLLIVLDVDHEQRGISPSAILGPLTRQGRTAVVLQAVAARDSGTEPERRSRRSAYLPVLRGTLDDSEVQRCQCRVSEIAQRWSLPMVVPPVEQWHQYLSATRWIAAETNGQASSCLFWVTLRFFVTEGMNLADSEQAERSLGRWIIERTDSITDTAVREIIDYIAALSSFRLPSPVWTVMRPAMNGMYSSAFSSAIRALEGIIEWRDPIRGTEEDILQFLHPALASVYLAHRIGARSPEERIRVLSPVISALSPGSPADTWLAETLAKEIFTPRYEERAAAEWDWRLSSFELLPPAIRNQNKTVLHHWARSLYQSTKQLPEGERIDRLLAAIGKLETATALPRRTGRDENPSHLYNTLGTAYYRYSRTLQGHADDEKSTAAWNSACAAFEKAIELSGGVNVEALLALSQRLLRHVKKLKEQGPEKRDIATSELTQVLDLLDEAQVVATNHEAPDEEWLNDIMVNRSEALKLLRSELGDSYVQDLIESSNPELGYYCKARLVLASGSEASVLDEALDVFTEAEQRGVALGARSIRLQLHLLERQPIERQKFTVLKDLHRRLELELSDTVRPLHLFRHAVLCYQTGAYSEGAERFQRLRAQFRNQDIPALRLQDMWRNPEKPALPRFTQMRVDNPITEWRAQGYLMELGQSIPFRPRHFSPPPTRGEIVTCAIRFESSGPLAVPTRFVETNRTRRYA